MKQFITLFFLFITLIASSQNYEKQYLNDNLEVIEKSRTANFYQYLYDDARFSIFRIDSKLYMKGSYMSKIDQRYNGTVVYYNIEGKEYKREEYKAGVLNEFLVTTTQELTQSYSEIGLVNVTLDFEENQYQFENQDLAIETAKEKLIIKCKRKGGDAIIGLKIEYQRTSGNEQGYILLYGTAVKLK